MTIIYNYSGMFYVHISLGGYPSCIANILRTIPPLCRVIGYPSRLMSLSAKCGLSVSVPFSELNLSHLGL